MTYYSASYLFSFFINTILHFDKFRGHHGLKISINGDNPSNIRVIFNKYGLFQRIVKTFSLILDSTVFSDYYMFFDSQYVKEEKITFIKNTNNFSINNPQFLLTDLINNITEEKIRGVYSNFTFDMGYTNIYNSRYFVKNTLILKDYLLIFVACNLARYNPYLWKEIYEGKTTDIFLHFQKAINGIDDVVNYISERFKGLEKTIEYL